MKRIITLFFLSLVFTNCFSQGLNITITPVFTSPAIEVGGYFGQDMRYQVGVRYRPDFMSVPSIKSGYFRYNFPTLSSRNPYAKVQGESRLYLGITFGKMEINSEDFYFDGGVLQGNIVQNSYSVEFGMESFYGPRKRGSFFFDFAFGHIPNYFKPLVIGLAENTSKWDNGKIGTKWGVNFGWRFYIGRKS